MKTHIAFLLASVLTAFSSLVQIFAACTPPPPGIVAWWPAEGNISDIVGTNLGVAHGGLGYNTGLDGKAFLFDNSTSYISLPASASLNVGTNAGMTIEAWVKPSAAGYANGVGPLLEWESDSNDWVDFWAGSGMFALLKDTNGVGHTVNAGNGILTTNNWQHVAFTYYKATGIGLLYVNGNVVASNTLGSFTPQTSYPLYIGQRTAPIIGQGSTYGGLMDELAIYGRALSQPEIQAIYNAGGEGKCQPPQPVPSCTPPPDGMVAWWPGQATGADIIGTNHAVVPAGVTYPNAKVGQGFGFDGNEFITISNAPVLNPANGLTIESWIYLYARPASNWTQTLVGKDNYCAGLRQYKLNVTDSTSHPGGANFRAAVGVPSGFVSLDGATLIQSNTWYHVAETYDGTTLKLYVNGVLDGQMAVTGAITNVTEPLRLGGDVFGGCGPQYFLKGVLDEPSIYNRALSSNEIAAIYLADYAGKCQAGPIAPVITQQPTNLTVTVSNTAVFAVTATGTTPLSYQWKFGGNNVAGEANATLTLSNVQLAQAGNYSVIVSNTAGSTNSAIAVLTVQPYTPPPPPPCTPAPSGIVGWWPGDGNGNDVVGGYNGAVQGASFATGEVGQAFSFNGASRVLVNNQAALNPTNQMTLEVWIYALARPSGDWSQNVFGKDGDCDDQRQYKLIVGDSVVHPGEGDFRAHIGVPAGYIIVDGATSVQSNIWYHVAQTYDGSMLRLYVNGHLDGQTNATGPIVTSANPLFIGGGPDCKPYNFKGMVDEPTLYNRALSSNEIAAIYAAGSAGKCMSLTVVSNGPPVITSISPATAIAGTNITISGNNFSSTPGGNIVFFGAVRANVTAASTNSLSVTVPPGAVFGPVTVTVGGLTAYSMQMFDPTFTGDGSNISTGSFLPSFNVPTTGGPGSIVIADLDGDGKSDVSFVSDANIVVVLRNISTNGMPLAAGSFAPAVNLPRPSDGIGSNPYRLRAADLDGDGKLDLIACDVNGNRVSVYHNIAAPGTITTNSFATPFSLISGGDCRFATAADLDGDGRVDVVALNYGDKTVSVFKNIGTPGTLTAASFAAPVILPAPGGCYEVAIADLNGDGKPDLAMACQDNNTVGIFQNQTMAGVVNSNSFAPRFDLPAGNAEAIMAVDLDGDGRLDLAVGAGTSDNVEVFRNLSTGGALSSSSFAPHVDFGTPGWMHTVSVADFNGDAKPDLGVVGELDSYMAIFQNLATPGSFTNTSFAPRVDFGTGWNAWGIASGDLDGDGRPDVVFCNYYDHNIQFYQNAVPYGTPSVAPVITIQPTNITVAVNGTAVFNVSATGTPAPTYQWSFNGANIPGAISTTLTLTNVQPEQAGNYAVAVANIAGSVISSNAVLTVNIPPAPPVILSQTPSQVVLVGSPVTFSVTATGYPLNYYWSRNDSVIPGATNSYYTIASAQLSDSGSKFSCLVSNALGTAMSTNASLKVLDTVFNDLCSGAVVIGAPTYTNSQSTIQASSFGDPDAGCVGGFGNGVWYQFTPPVNGLIYVDTFGSDFDTGLGAFAGTCDSLVEVACDDDTLGVTSQVIVPASAGTAYYFLAGGYGGHVGNLVVHMNFFTLPHFDVQPTNLAVVISSNAIFGPVVSGTQPIGLQWYFNNAPLVDGGRISGATSATLTIANVQTNDGGNYYLAASNFVGVATSSVAVLTPVVVPPFFVQPPVDQFIGQGSNATFSAVADGTAPYSYQWYYNSSPLSDDGVHYAGATTSSLTISNISAGDGGSYSLTVANSAGSTDASASLVVLLPPSITKQPVGRSVPPGLPTTFTVSVSGNPTGYQWLLNGTNVPGANTTSYTVPAVGANDLGSYQLVASNAIGTTVSSAALLTFGPVAAWGRNQVGESLPPPNLSGVVNVAGQSLLSMALRTNGTFVSWGLGSITNIPTSATNVVAFSLSEQGQAVALRADGTAVVWNTASATVPAGASNLVAVSSGGNGFGLGLRADGSVVGWGTLPFSTVPAGLNHVVSIACGYQHSVAARKDGTVVSWGVGTATNVPAGMTNIVSVAAGNNFFLALRNNGTVAAWGVGGSTNVPAGLSNVAAIYTGANNAASANFNIAVRSNGTIVTWGNNTSGQTNPPTALSNLLTVAAAAATDHGLALVNDGSPQILVPPVGLTAYTGRDLTLPVKVVGAQPLSFQWLKNGTNFPGATNAGLVLKNIQLADAGNYQLFVSNSIGSAVSLAAPIKVIASPFVSLVGAIGLTASNVYQGATEKFYAAPVLGSGPLRYQWFWGPTNRNWLPVTGGTNEILTLDPALAVQSGFYYLSVSNLTFGVTSAPVNIKVQFARAWGFQAVSNPPVNVTNAIAVAIGGTVGNVTGDYLALTADGKVYGWNNGSGGATNLSATIAGLSNQVVTAIAVGSQAGELALKSDGTVFAWGAGALYGQTNIPAGLNGVVAISAGGYHDMALKSDGTVVSWGAVGQVPFNYGQATNNPGATNVVAISAGLNHSLALRADGTVVQWGNISELPFPTPSNFVAIAAGSSFNLGLRANGTVQQWGSGLANYPVPANLSNIVAIAANGMHATALRNDGTVVSWGNAYIGLASNNVPADAANVVQVSSGGDRDFVLLGNRAPWFTVQPWNQTYVIGSSAKLTLAGKAVGVQPVSYQWKLNGTNLPGATSDTLILTNQPSLGGPAISIQPGSYQLVASNAYAVVASKPAKVTGIIPLGIAVDATNFAWTTSGGGQWFGQTNITHDGIDAARSGGIGPLQETVLQTTISNAAGNISFWWKVSSEQFFDLLEFRVNGTTMASVSGEVDWQQAIIPVSAGTNVLQWRYAKDSSFDSGLDAAFMDQFGFVAAPQITRQPLPSITADQGATVVLSVSATGQPAMGYKWQQNGNPVGGNSPALIMNDVGRAQDGVYSVTVTNAGGAAMSSNAVVHIIVPQVLGSPTVLPDGTLQFTSSDLGGGAIGPDDLANFEAQASTDLVNWFTLPNSLSLSNGVILLQDNSNTNAPSRYYRLVEH